MVSIQARHRQRRRFRRESSDAHRQRWLGALVLLGQGIVAGRSFLRLRAPDSRFALACWVFAADHVHRLARALLAISQSLGQGSAARFGRLRADASADAWIFEYLFSSLLSGRR